MTVYYTHKAIFLLATLNSNRGLCPFIKWVGKNEKIFKQVYVHKGEVPRVTKFG